VISDILAGANIVFLYNPFHFTVCLEFFNSKMLNMNEQGDPTAHWLEWLKFKN
jgi:hypothetical protein